MTTTSHSTGARTSAANSSLAQTGPVTFDFTAGVVAATSAGGPINSPIARQTVGNDTLVLTANAGTLAHLDEQVFSTYDVEGLYGMTVAVDIYNRDITAATVIRLAIEGGRTFDLSELAALDLSAYGLTVEIRTNKTSTPITFTIPPAQFDDNGQMPSEALHVVLSNEPALVGIEWAELSNAMTGELILLQLDNIVLSNIEPLTTAPVFVTPGNATLNVNQNGGAIDLASLLHVNDPNAGDTLTWTVLDQGDHGVAQLTGATANGGAADITPGGTLRYTPAIGYAGTDSVTIQVSDGSLTATRTINFNVVPLAPGALDLAAGSDTGLLNNDNVTAANNLTLSGTSAADDTTSTVTVFIDGDGDGVFDSGEKSSTATLADGAWTVNSLSTTGLNGTFNVYAFVTSSNGAVVGPRSGALAVTIDHTGPTTSLSGIGISNDSGTSSTDFTTNAAAQTITATLSQALGAGEKLRGSLDNGVTWADITDRVSGTMLEWTGATLVANGAIVLRLEDQHGNAGTAATRNYVLDTTPPGTVTTMAAMGGDSNGDFIVANVNQTVAGILSAPLQAGERVRVSTNGGDSWADASTSTGSSTWSITGRVLDATGTLQVQVLDLAGNGGPVYSRNYIVDTVRPTAQVAADTDLLAPTGNSFQVAVTWVDTGGGGIDSFSFNVNNITVTAPGGASLTVQSYSINGNVVTYTVAAPGGNWDVQDTGRYTVGINANSVRDLANNSVEGVASAGVIDVSFSNAPSVGGLSLSRDNGISGTDFHTNETLQTIGATLARALLPGEIVQGSIDNGASWSDISDSVDGTALSWRDVSLPASGTIVIRVLDADSHAGTAASHAYTIDSAPPTASVATATLSDDSGSNAHDFITKGVVQNISGTLSTPRVGDEFVQVALDNSGTWYTASGSGSAWALNGFLLPPSGTLQVRVADTAGNHGPAWTQEFLLDQTAPTAGTPVRANLVDPTGSSFTFTVTYADGGAGIDTATAGSDNVSVNGPGGALTVTNYVVDGNVITYTAQAPGGDWDALDAGAYTIGISGTLRDIAGNAVAANAAAHNFTVGFNSAPVLGGTFATPSIGDDDTVKPFSGVTLSDIDGDAITLAITYTAAGGTLTGTGLTGSAGNYVVTGSAAAVQAALRDLTFTPAANASSGAAVVTTFTLAASDGKLAHVNSATVVTVTPVAPTASIALSDTELLAGESAVLTITFSEAVSGLDLQDVIMPGGTLGVLNTNDNGLTWSATFTPEAGLAFATRQVLLDMGGVVDAGGLAGAGTLFGPNYTVSTGRPTATLAVADTDLRAGETSLVTIAFSEAVSGFAVDDLSVANGALSNLTNLDGGVNWTATLTPSANAWVDVNSIGLNLSGVRNAAGNAGLGVATSNAYAVHTGSAPAPDPIPTPVGTIDGVDVVTGSTTDPVTGLVSTTLTVPVVTGTRTEDPATPNASLADIPLTATGAGVTSTLTVGLPVGAGLQASSTANLLTREQGLLDLIRRIEEKTASGSDARDEMSEEGVAFLRTLVQDSALHTATLTPLAGSGAGAGTTIAISGGATSSTAIGLVIDATQLPGSATLQLDNVAFAAIVGAATLRGGAGNNIVVGDEASQNIYLGAGDDVLFGGGGNDIVGSAGGNDLLEGGSGNDLLVGGIGNDTLRGGSGNDVLQAGGSARGDWEFTLRANGTLGAIHEGAVFAAGVPVTLALAQLDVGEAELAFLGAPRASLVETALLYHAAFGRAPDIGGLNFYLGHNNDAASVARGFIASSEWAGRGMNALSDSDFLHTLYRQVLDRAPDAGGLAYWSDQLAQASVSRADVLRGFALSDEHRALQGADLVVAAARVDGENGWLAAAGDNRLEGGAGNDLLIGGDGVDTIVYSGALADVRLVLRADGAVTVVDKASGDTDTLHGIERGAFSDGTVDLGFTQNDAAALKTLGLLYQTVFDRSGDIGGFGWWAASGERGATLVAGFVAGSGEFAARYDALSDADFVAALYANSGLDAQAAGGSGAWVAMLDTATRVELIGNWIGNQAVQDAQLAGGGLWLV